MITFLSTLILTASTGLFSAPGQADSIQADTNPADAIEIVQVHTSEELQMSLPDAARCFNCAKDSDGACSMRGGKSRIQCTGSRADCWKRGCRINGSSSCSSASNVGKC